MAAATLAPEQRWIAIYSPYIDNKKTIPEGRRIPLEKACENPTPQEIADSVKHLKFEYRLEAKHYSRDNFAFGRVRVQLKKDDGTPVNPAIPTRKALLLEIAKLVPKHAGRQGKKPGAPALQSAGGGGGGGGGGGSGGGGKGGKKGKKGR